jgi:hypothetical protein
MDLRKSFLKPFKKVKQKFTGGRDKSAGRSGNENDVEGRETDVEGSEAGQKDNPLHPGVEDVESGPSRERDDVGGREVGQVDPPTFTPSISHGGEPNSM